MKIILEFVFIVLFTSMLAFGKPQNNPKPITNNIWMPTGYTLNENEFEIGIGPVNVGLTDRIQFKSNILLFLFQNYNANLKINIIQISDLAIAAGLDLMRYNMFILKHEQEFRYNTISPFLVFSKVLDENTYIHFAGRFDLFGSDESGDKMRIGISEDQLIFMAGIEQTISRRTKLLFESGYLVGDPGIQIGVGILLRWTHFRLKLGVGYYNSQGERNGFTLPVIGIWWRFNG
jgi:hypothetical protein